MITSPPALPARTRLPLSVLGLFGFVVALVLGLLYAGTSSTTGVDEVLFSVFSRAEGTVRSVAVAIDFSSEPVGAVLVLLVAGFACLRCGRFRTAVLLVVSCGVTVALTTGLKPLTGRLIHGEFLSFPSGHTAFLVTVAVVVALLVIDVRGVERGVWVLVGFVVLAGVVMGWSQVVLRAHYPTDVFAGVGVALAVVPVVGVVVDHPGFSL